MKIAGMNGWGVRDQRYGGQVLGLTTPSSCECKAKSKKNIKHTYTFT